MRISDWSSDVCSSDLRINRVVIDTPARKLGIISTGKAVQDVQQAFKLLGLNDDTAAALGLSFYKLGCMYPVEREGLAEFAVGQEELLLIEEKEPLVENQAKAILYGRPDTPRIVGKVDEDGVFMRSEERREGKGGGRTCRFR